MKPILNRVGSGFDVGWCVMFLSQQFNPHTANLNVPEHKRCCVLVWVFNICLGCCFHIWVVLLWDLLALNEEAEHSKAEPDDSHVKVEPAAKTNAMPKNSSVKVEPAVVAPEANTSDIGFGNSIVLVACSSPALFKSNVEASVIWDCQFVLKHMLRHATKLELLNALDRLQLMGMHRKHYIGICEL